MKILASSLLCAVCAFGLELNAEMKAYIDELKKEAKEQNPSFVDFSAKNGEILLIFLLKSITISFVICN